jgi:hypothetical protein
MKEIQYLLLVTGRHKINLNLAEVNNCCTIDQQIIIAATCKLAVTS